MDNYYGHNELQVAEKPTSKTKKVIKNCILLTLLVVFIAFILFKVYPNQETWEKYKPYHLSTMTQEEKEQYAIDYMLDEYGIKVSAEYYGTIGGSTTFSRAYPMVTISPIDSYDKLEYYHIYFDGHGKICDDYYLHDIQEQITEQIKHDIEDLPYDCVVATHTYTYSPYFPTYKMKIMANDNLLKFLKMKKTITRIDFVFSYDCVEHKDELCKTLEEITSSYINADGNLFFIDGDINQIDLSNLDPSTLLAFY